MFIYMVALTFLSTRGEGSWQRKRCCDARASGGAVLRPMLRSIRAQSLF